MNRIQKIQKKCSKKGWNHDRVHPISPKIFRAAWNSSEVIAAAFFFRFVSPSKLAVSTQQWPSGRDETSNKQSSAGLPVWSMPKLCGLQKSLVQLKTTIWSNQTFQTVYIILPYACTIYTSTCVCMICKIFGVGIPGIQGSLRNSNWLHLWVHSVYTYTYVYEYNIYIYIYILDIFLEYTHERVINKYI